jgi:hypothetical protein
MAIEKYVIPLLLGQRNEILTSPACLVTDDIQAYTFEFSIKDNEGYPVDTSWVTSAVIKMSKPDAEVITGTVNIDENGIFTYTLGTNELAVEGYVLSMLQLHGGATRISTQIFRFRVIHEIVGEAEIPSTSEYSILTDLIAQVQALYDAGAATTTYVDQQDDAVLVAAKLYVDNAIAAIPQTDMAAHEAIQQLRTNFVQSYGESYKEITKTGDLVTSINIWVDSTKVTALFTRIFTYLGELVDTIVTTDHTNNKILTKSFTYNVDDEVETITEVIT